MSFSSARKKAGLSQAAAAERIGVSSAAVCQWETGATSPRLNMLTKIADAYGCTLEDLLSDQENLGSVRKEGRG